MPISVLWDFPSLGMTTQQGTPWTICMVYAIACKLRHATISMEQESKVKTDVIPMTPNAYINPKSITTLL